MEYDAFVKILKYNTSENLTPLENYITEVFVFLLNYLDKSKKMLFYKILRLFKISKNKKIEINTQPHLKKHVPDIYIETDNRITIIEVKINSNLKIYPYKGKSINQYELYSKEYNDANVFLLTKHVVFENNIPEKNKILWTDIVEILEKSDDYIVKCFKHILEENGMYSIKLNKELLTAFGAIINWKLLIENSWRYGDKFPLSPIAFNKQNDDFWVRYYVKDKRRNQNILYIGTISSEPENLYVYLLKDLKQFKEFYGKFNGDDECFVDRFDLEKMFYLNGKQQ
jgi:hypothetical protein